MKKALQFIFLTMLLLSALNAFSQDTIVKVDGEIIQAKVLKINSNKVDYKLFINPDGPVYEVNKSEIKYIKYQNGTTDIFTTNIFGNRTLKFELLSPLAGDIAFGYEQKISPILTGEFKIGFIDDGRPLLPNSFFLNTQSDRGFFTKIGLKLITKINNCSRFSNYPSWFYIKPEFILSSYSGVSIAENSSTNFTNKSLGADLSIGFQRTIAKRFFIEEYFGTGWVVTSVNYGETTTIPGSPNSLYSTIPFVGTDGDLPNFGFGSLDNKSYSKSNSHFIFTLGFLVGYSFK